MQACYDFYAKEAMWSPFGTVDAVYLLEREYTLYISTTTGGTTDPAPGFHAYVEGTSVAVTAIPSSGYNFDHWELDGVNVGATNPISVTMDRDHTLNAVFVATAPPPPPPPPPGMGTLECHAYIDTTEIKVPVEVVGVGGYTTPFTVNLAPGSYSLNAKYDTQTLTKDVTITEGSVIRVDLKFVKPTGPLGLWNYPVLTRLAMYIPWAKYLLEYSKSLSERVQWLKQLLERLHRS
jgi:hypothetical protein